MFCPTISIDQDLQNYLESFLTPERIERMKTVLKQRTYYIMCVLEDLYDPRNGSAVIRHCDAFGIQEIQAIENKNQFRNDRQVDMGTGQWLDIHTFGDKVAIPRSVKSLRRVSNLSGRSRTPPSNTPYVLKAIKERGYRIVATSPQGKNTLTPEKLNLSDGPVAIVFGSEKHGISNEVRSLSDVSLTLPMYGFVDSLNISASAAIIFSILSNRLRTEKIQWQLNVQESREIYFRWVKNSIPNIDKIIQHYRENL